MRSAFRPLNWRIYKMQKILRKRVFRDLKENLFRYLALGLLIILGMYLIVSMVGAADTVIDQTKIRAEKNHLEDGEFGVFVPLTDLEIKQLTDKGVEVEKMFYLDFKMDNENTIRVFKNRTGLNLVDLDEGNPADSTDEIVLEKRYCQENKIEVGDSITIAGHTFTVTGIGSTPDYEAPYQNFSDANAQSSEFGTAFLTEDAYQALLESGKSEKAEAYQYAYQLNGAMTDKEFKEKLKKFEYDPEAVNDAYFKEYWDRTAGKKDELQDGIQKLADGSKDLTDALDALAENNGDLQSGAAQILDAFLQQANEGFAEYGLSEPLTEDNFEQVIKQLKETSQNAFLNIKLNSVLQQLKSLKAYKDGVTTYTNGVGEASDGSKELSDGIQELKEQSDELMDSYFKVEKSNLTFFMTAEDNPRIGAAGDDQVINKLAGLAAGVIIMILFTYVISVFVIHGIEKESTVIGALYALGVTRKNLIFHYLSLPVIVTFLAGLIGTIAGFSKWGVPVQMQDCYNYYSVPVLDMEYPAYLLVYSLVMPSVVAIIVNCLVIWKRLSRPVLSMLRAEQKTGKISHLDLGNMGFVSRFRIRQMLREMRSAFTVIFGMFISLLILMIGINCYVLCENIRTKTVEDTKFEYMYTYKYPEKSVPDGADPAYAKTLKKEIFGYNLDVTLLGIKKDNPYFDVDVQEGKNKVIISSAMAEKYQLNKGDTLVLSDNEEDMDYAFEVAGITEYEAGFYAFMDIDSMRDLFGMDDDYYNVAFSDHALDIDAGRLYATTSREDIKKSSGVFSNQMKPMVYTMCGVAAIIFFVVMYLMMKVMIDRSSYGISLIKVFGYRSSEIRKLYLNGNFYMIAIGAAICVPLSKLVMDAMYPALVSNVACGIRMQFTWQMYIGIYAAIIVLYFLINQLLILRLNKIVPSEFLKNRE